MNLNIIGNGFDLYHGLPSSYYYFGCYLAKNNYEFYEEICNMYNLIYAHMTSYMGHDYDYVVEDIFWSEFEKHLGDVDDGFILDTHNYDLGLEINEDFDIPMNEDAAAETLKKAFIHWIIDTIDKKENYQVINRVMARSGKNYKINFIEDDRFVVFNYTHTLQHIYKIEDWQVLYVHGECTGNEDDELEVGHGNDSRINEIEKIIESYNNKPNSQDFRTKENEYRCLYRYLKKLRKDVNYCMHICDSFYKRIHTRPHYIIVYGMSLGDVDIPYLKQIRDIWKDTKWRFSYFTDSDLEKIKYVCKQSLGLRQDEYEIFEFGNPTYTKILDKIVSIQGIEKYETAEIIRNKQTQI